jgi:hypothetical protein
MDGAADGIEGQSALRVPQKPGIEIAVRGVESYAMWFVEPGHGVVLGVKRCLTQSKSFS